MHWALDKSKKITLRQTQNKFIRRKVKREKERKNKIIEMKANKHTNCIQKSILKLKAEVNGINNNQVNDEWSASKRQVIWWNEKWSVSRQREAMRNDKRAIIFCFYCWNCWLNKRMLKRRSVNGQWDTAANEIFFHSSKFPISIRWISIVNESLFRFSLILLFMLRCMVA